MTHSQGFAPYSTCPLTGTEPSAEKETEFQFNGWNVILLIITQGRPFCNIIPKNHLPENAGHCRGNLNPAR